MYHSIEASMDGEIRGAGNEVRKTYSEYVDRTSRAPQQ